MSAQRIIFTQAAASSIAKGMPSTSWQKREGFELFSRPVGHQRLVFGAQTAQAGQMPQPVLVIG